MGSLNLYLIKQGFTVTPRHFVSNGAVVEQTQSVFDIAVCFPNQPLIEALIRTLGYEPKNILLATSPHEVYYRNLPRHAPDWVAYWDIQNPITVQSASALAFVRSSGQLFAVCHGFSSYLLNPYCIERNFGLRAALNALDPDKISTTDLVAPAETTFLTRKKTPNGAAFGDFDINIFNNLLKTVAGKVLPQYKTLFSSVDGSDRLHISTGATANDLDGILGTILDLHRSDAYKKGDFSWIDNFTVVRDPAILAKLDDELINLLNNQHPSVSIFIPTSLDYSGAVSFRLSGLGHKTVGAFNNIDVKATLYRVLASQKIALTDKDDLKRLFIEVTPFDDSSSVLERHPISRCVYCEIQDSGHRYFLESGNWYSVQPSFLADLEAEVNQITSSRFPISLSFDKNDLRSRHFTGKGTSVKKMRYEYWFNLDLQKHLSSQGRTAECLDANNVSVTGRSKVEICDVLTKNKGNTCYLIHNKCNTGSHSLTHLFAQGHTSAQMLTDPDFRVSANKKISTQALQFPHGNAFNQRNYVVVYGIIGYEEKNGILKLPVFSMLSLKVFHQTIRSMSYAIKFALVTDTTT
jgi:uncharacterized protein (TIGR04141 family)